MRSVMGEELNVALALEGRSKVAPANAGLLTIAGALAQLPDPEIDTNFMLALEQRLLTEGLDAEPIRHLQVVKAEPAFPQTPADEVVRVAPVINIARRRGVVRRSLAAGLTAAMVSAFPLVAAAKSLPGSPFYGLKTTLENAQIAMFGGAVDDGFAHLELAQRRIDEAAQLAALGADQDLIAETLRSGDEHLKAGKGLILDNTSNPVDLQKLADMAEDAETDIANLEGVTGGAQQAMQGALRTAKSIQDDVADALGLDLAVPTASVSMPSTDTTSASLTGGTTYTTSSDTGSKSTSSGSSTKRNPGDRTKPGDDGDGRNLEGPGGGCEIFGSQQFGDLGTVVTRLTCE